MQFRSGTPLRVATLFGHTAVIGPEWRDLPPAMHGQAVAMGAEFRDTDGIGKILPPPLAPLVGAGVDDRVDLAKVTDAIKKMLAANDPAAFHRSGGQPKIAVVSKTAGFNVAKEDLLASWAALQAELELGIAAPAAALAAVKAE